MKLYIMAHLDRTFARLAIAILASAIVAAPVRAAEAREKEKIPAVNWGACETPAFGFECAKYVVPLDYARPHEKEIELALVLHRATDQKHRISTLFFNPGGPGGQGTVDLPNWLSFFPAAIQERFDILSWDPRGIGASTAVLCFASMAEETAFFANVAPYFPIGAEKERVWLDTYASYGNICEQRNGELLAHVSTADTARDMERVRQALGERAMNYLGVSYGTLLGAEYANMFPDKVRAMVLDGNVDPAAWRNDYGLDPVLSTSLRLGSDLAAAKSLNAFLDLCGEASAENCAFRDGNAEKTHIKFDKLLERLKYHSVTISGLKIDDAALVGLMNGYLFTGHSGGGFFGWIHAGTTLEQVWTLAFGAQINSSATSNSSTTPRDPREKPEKYVSDRQVYAVQCAESPNPHNPKAFIELARFAYRRSGSLIGPVQTWADEPCSSWQAEAAEPYLGAWNHPTANPILVIGNTYDPSTPYEGSLAMVKELANARLLTVEGYGHTTLLNPSDCANQAEANYFINGTLPEEGKICRQNKAPFEP